MSDKRVFILGAGASVYAGFPTANHLWSFLLDHNGVDSSAMEWIDAHLAAVPAQQRAELTYDIERLLTGYQDRAPNPVSAWREQTSTPRKLERKDQAEIRNSHRHYLANPKQWNFSGYFEARAIRRQSHAVNWYPMSLNDLVLSLRDAFLHHHDCIKPGKGCYSPADKMRFENCSCFPRRSFHQSHWRLREEIKRLFRRGDVIITFNWDCLLETFLWQAGLWNMRDGYGLPVTFDAGPEKRLDRGQLRAISRPSPVKMLKAHGSLNWVMNWTHDELGLDELDRLFDLPFHWSYPVWSSEDGNESDFEERAFLAPTYKKDYDETIFKRLWEQLDDAIRTAGKIVIAGYSLPRSDTNSRDRLIAALKENKTCATLELVTPECVVDTEWAAVAESVDKKILKIGSRFENWAAGSKQ
jgi:hypothetical protein